MSLQPVKNVSEYKRLKQTLRNCFESEKTGDQTLFEEQSKKYEPLLSSQKDLTTNIQNVANQIVESQNGGQATLTPLLQLLLPLLQNMRRARIAAPGQTAIPTSISPSQYTTPQTSLMGQSSGQDSISHIPLPIVPIAPVSSRKDIIRVDLDEKLDQQDIDNLNDMKLPLPSKVYGTDTISQTLE